MKVVRQWIDAGYSKSVTKSGLRILLNLVVIFEDSSQSWFERTIVEKELLIRSSQQVIELGDAERQTAVSWQ